MAAWYYYIPALVLIPLTLGLMFVARNDNWRSDLRLTGQSIANNRGVILKAQGICGLVCATVAMLWGFIPSAVLMLLLLISPLMPYTGTVVEYRYTDPAKQRSVNAEKVAFGFAAFVWMVICLILYAITRFKGFSPWPER